MNIQLNDVIEVQIYVDHGGKNTLDGRLSLGVLGTKYVRVIGSKTGYITPFGVLGTEYLIGWDDIDLSSIMIGSRVDFELTEWIVDFDNYPARWWINEGVKVIKIVPDLCEPAPVKSNGMNCKGCNDHFPIAEANQSDGSLVCYSCRTYYSWKYCKGNKNG